MKKKCSKCKKVKGSLEFHNASNTWDGKRSECKACAKITTALRPKGKCKVDYIPEIIQRNAACLRRMSIVNGR